MTGWIVFFTVGLGITWAVDHGKGRRVVRAGEQAATGLFIALVVGVSVLLAVGIVWTVVAVLVGG